MKQLVLKDDTTYELLSFILDVNKGKLSVAVLIMDDDTITKDEIVSSILQSNGVSKIIDGDSEIDLESYDYVEVYPNVTQCDGRFYLFTDSDGNKKYAKSTVLFSIVTSSDFDDNMNKLKSDKIKTMLDMANTCIENISESIDSEGIFDIVANDVKNKMSHLAYVSQLKAYVNQLTDTLEVNEVKYGNDLIGYNAEIYEENLELIDMAVNNMVHLIFGGSLPKARKINLIGDIVGSVTFDGSKDETMTTLRRGCSVNQYLDTISATDSGCYEFCSMKKMNVAEDVAYIIFHVTVVHMNDNGIPYDVSNGILRLSAYCKKIDDEINQDGEEHISLNPELQWLIADAGLPCEDFFMVYEYPNEDIDGKILSLCVDETSSVNGGKVHIHFDVLAESKNNIRNSDLFVLYDNPQRQNEQMFKSIYAYYKTASMACLQGSIAAERISPKQNMNNSVFFGGKLNYFDSDYSSYAYDFLPNSILIGGKQNQIRIRDGQFSQYHSNILLGGMENRIEPYGYYGSIIGGYKNRADYDQIVLGGKYNVNQGNALLEIGCGTSDSNRKNAFMVDYDGKIYSKNNSLEGFDYEEGIWTPTLNSLYSDQNVVPPTSDVYFNGRYFKLGNLVFLIVKITCLKSGYENKTYKLVGFPFPNIDTGNIFFISEPYSFYKTSEAVTSSTKIEIENGSIRVFLKFDCDGSPLNNSIIFMLAKLK